MWFAILTGLSACDGDGPTADGQTTDTGAHSADTATPTDPWECVIPAGEAPDSSHQVGCMADFDALASEPLDASIPGARSVKTLVDRSDGNNLWFANSREYPIHWDFAFANLSVANGLPPVPDLAGFNQTEYYSPDRRFILGAVTYYEGPAAWVYEISPYDTADAAMIETAFDLIRDNSFFGKDLYFHPTSQAVESVAETLPDDIPIITTDDLFAGIDYQPYNFGTTTGLLAFRTALEVDGTYTPYRELVVLDAVPNDISIVAGIITSEFQTPLAHINVLSVNRGTPNMALRDGFTNEELRSLEGKWVELTVGPFEYEIHEITEAEADAWWEANRPPPLTVPTIDSSVRDLRDVEDVVADDAPDLQLEIETAITAFGSKGTNYSALFDIGAAVPMQEDGFVIPFFWYQNHMQANGLDARLLALEADPQWGDPQFRIDSLEAFKLEIMAAPINPLFLQALLDKVAADFPATGDKVRFRSSTNAEDLGNFTGAGLYNSQTGDPTLPESDPDSVAAAIKEAWANLWNPRAYEERGYYSIDQHAVGMALLTTPNFPDEEANGVAVTNNIYDVSGLEPGFYVNVQIGENEVVQPDLGVTPDSYIHYFYQAGQPVVYISHSNLIAPGTTVLTNRQVYDLGVALDAIHQRFYPVYGDDGEWYGMDVEFKFDDKLDPGGEPTLFVKQARPFPWDPGASGASR